MTDLEINSTTVAGKSFPISFLSTNTYSISCSTTARILSRVVKRTGQTFDYQSDASTKYHIDIFTIGF
jgi:hypothetical protein